MKAMWVLLCLFSSIAIAAQIPNYPTGVNPPGTGSGLPAGPTSPNGVPQQLCSTPSGGVAGVATWCEPGVVPRTVSGTSDTIVATDRSAWVVYTSTTGDVAVTLPQANSAGFDSNFVVGVKVGESATGIVTITPTTSTIDSKTTLVIGPGQSCTISSDNANYTSRCAPSSVNEWYSYSGGNATLAMIPAQNATDYIGLPITAYMRTTTGICYYVATADNTANVYDIGLYNRSGNLVVHTGATAGTTLFASTGTKCVNWATPGTVVQGLYVFAITSSAATPVASLGGTNTSTAFEFNFAAVFTNGGVTTGGALNSTITFPTVTWAPNRVPSVMLF